MATRTSPGAAADDDLIVVEVALVGGWSELSAFDTDCLRPYSDRPLKTIRVEQQSTIQAMLDQAATAFSTTHPGDYTTAGQAIDFYRGSPSETVAATIPMIFTVTLVDESGAARWHVPPSDATLAEAMIAFEAGAFRGDPCRPYLLVDPTAGMAGGTPGGWGTFLAIYMAFAEAKTHWETLKTICKVSKSTVQTLDRLAGRYAAMAKAVEAASGHLEARGADISDVIDLLSTGQVQRIADVMVLLGVDDPAIAEDLVGIAGFEALPDSEWFAPIQDDGLRNLAVDIPMSLSMEMLSGPSEDPEQAEREIMHGLADYLVGEGLAEWIDSVDG